MTNTIPQKDFIDEFKQGYTTYANYVIRDRAIPSVLDGLKPVHRRIIFTTGELGLVPGKPHKKCAKIVGEVMGKYHPHGDKAIYDSLVRLSQDFLTRYPLLDMQGNNGCIDNPDSFAAMRYTEGRLTSLALDYTEGLDEDVVDFAPNFDETESEPTILPTKIPVPLLVNGTHGIGVSLATSIPPHNIGELVEGTLAYMDNNDITIEELMQYIKGPDFPTCGQILGSKEIHQAYTTGRASIPLRGKIEMIDDKKKGRHLLITELPFQVSGEEIKDAVVKLIEDKKIVGVGNPINETKDTIQVTIPLKRDANPNIIINALYKYTRLQTSFGANIIALDENKIPKTWTLKELIVHHVNFRFSVITRQTQFRLKKAQEELHFYDGLVIALDNLEAVIQTIKTAQSSDDARQKLIANYNLTEIQANKVLEMQLRRLASLERERIYQKQKELQAAVIEYQGILADPEKVRGIIRAQLADVKAKYGEERKTEICYEAKSSIDLEATIPNLPTAVMVTRMGYVKRIPPEAIDERNRGSKGSKGMEILDSDWLVDCFKCQTLDTLLVFTNQGKVHPLKAYLIPEKAKNTKGTNLVNLLQFDPGELVSAVIPMDKNTAQKYLLLATKDGMACRVDKSAYDLRLSRGVKAMKLREGDELLTVKLCNETDIAVFGTDAGFFAKIPVEMFGERQSRSSMGVRSMTLKRGGKIVGFDIISEADNSDLAIITTQGIGKKINISEIPNRRRSTTGTVFIKMKDPTDRVASFCLVKSNSLMIITANGIVNRLSPEKLRELKGRGTSGCIVMRLNPGDEISSITNAPKDETEEVLGAIQDGPQ